MDARQAQWLGSIRIGRSPSFSVVTGGALVLAGALIAFAIWGEITRKATVHGVLLPIGGLINVNAPQAGVVTEILVREGDMVEASQPILRLRSERITASGDTETLNRQALAARRESLQIERRLTEQNLQQRQAAAAQRIQSLQAEGRQAEAELDTHRLRLQLASKTLERQQELARNGFVASAQVQLKQEELLDLQLRERNAERNLHALARDINAARAESQSLAAQAHSNLAQLDRSLASLSQEAVESDSRHGLTVTAPQTARVTALNLNAGQSVQMGQTLASLVPISKDKGADDSEPLQAQLFAPSRTSGFIKPGQAVWIRFAAFPFQKFGMTKGEVLAISRSPLAANDLPNGQSQALLAATQSAEPLYRITVGIATQHVQTYGTRTPLAAGMSLDADVSLDTRKIWEVLMEPILATTARLH